MAIDSNNIINQISGSTQKVQESVDNTINSFIERSNNTQEQINKYTDLLAKNQKILDDALLIRNLYRKYKEDQEKDKINKIQKKKRKLPKGIGGIILSLLKQSSTVNDRFNKSLETILNQLSESCPSEEVLKKLIKEKNNLSNALNQTLPYLQQAEKVGNTLTPVLTALKIITQILKNLPLPTAVPPGVGIPVNVINKFSDILVKSDKKIDKTSAIINQITSAISIIKSLIEETLQTITALDSLLEVCFQQITQNMSEEEKNKFKNEITPDDNIFIFPGLYKEFIYDKEYVNVTSALTGLENNMIRLYANKSTSNGNIRLEGNLFFTPNNLQLINDIKIVIDNYLNPKTVTTTGNYRGFTYNIETNKNNKLQIPQRRAIGIKNNIKLSTEYSFTPNTQILIEELKFIIDNYLDKNITTNVVDYSNNIPTIQEPNLEEIFSSQISDITTSAYKYVDYNIIDSYYNDVKIKLNNGTLSMNEKLFNELKNYEYVIKYFNENGTEKTQRITFNNFSFKIKAIKDSIDKNTIKTTTSITIVKEY
jgi:hypothetical protein